MKRIIALILSLVMIGSLCACGDKKDTNLIESPPPNISDTKKPENTSDIDKPNKPVESDIPEKTESPEDVFDPYKFVSDKDYHWTDISDGQPTFEALPADGEARFVNIHYVDTPLYTYMENADWDGLMEELSKRYVEDRVEPMGMADIYGVRAGGVEYESYIDVKRDDSEIEITATGRFYKDNREDWGSTVQILQDFTGIALNLENIEHLYENVSQDSSFIIQDDDFKFYASWSLSGEFTVNIAGKVQWLVNPIVGTVAYAEDVTELESNDLPEGWIMAELKQNRTSDDVTPVPLPAPNSEFYGGGVLKWDNNDHGYNLQFKMTDNRMGKNTHDWNMLTIYRGTADGYWAKPWNETVGEKHVKTEDYDDERIIEDDGIIAFNLMDDDYYRLRACLPRGENFYVLVDINTDGLGNGTIEALQDFANEILELYGYNHKITLSQNGVNIAD